VVLTRIADFAEVSAAVFSLQQVPQILPDLCVVALHGWLHCLVSLLVINFTYQHEP
jgi:hypothetical protein